MIVEPDFFLAALEGDVEEGDLPTFSFPKLSLPDR